MPTLGELFDEVRGRGTIIGAGTNVNGTTVFGRKRRPPRPARRPGTRLLVTAGVLLVALSLAQGYVSWKAQYTFVAAAKHVHLASALEALGLDTATVIFALLGLAHARMGRPAHVERILNAACALGSMTMNLLAANLGSPRSVAVYVLPPVLYVAASDRLIAVCATAAGVDRGPVWRWAPKAGLYGLRLVLAPLSTSFGLRRWVLAATPLPASAQPPSKTVKLLGLYAGHDGYGDRAQVPAVARELASEAGLTEASARAALYKHLRKEVTG